MLEMVDFFEGFAFIDLCRKRYDVILMNPPFGEEGKNSKPYIIQKYPDSKGNVLANFVERQLELINPLGLIGAITSRSCYYLGSFDKYRKNLLAKYAQFHCFADFGDGVLDALVETAAYCLGKAQIPTKSLPFFRLLIESEKGIALLDTIQSFNQGLLDERIFISSLEMFTNLPSVPFAYWIDVDVTEAIISKPPIEPAGCHMAVGLQTGLDWRFLRLAWEVDPSTIASWDNKTTFSSDFKQIQKWYNDIFTNSEITWAYYSKTDEVIPWYSPIHMLVKWEKHGEEIRNFVDNRSKPRSAIRNQGYYFLPGLSYMPRTTRLVPYVVPAGIVPTAGRSTVFPNRGDETNILLLLSSNLGSAVARFFGENFARPFFQKGMVQQIPFKKLDNKIVTEGRRITIREINARRVLCSHIEPYQDFICYDYFSESALLCDDLTTLLGEDLEIKIANDFGITAQGYQQLEKDILEAVSVRAQPDDKKNGDLDQGVEASIPSVTPALNKAESVISYLVGLVFGRWDIRYATREKTSPELPDPFAPMPACPPGMLQNTQCLPASPKDVPEDYPLRISWPGVLVDDEGHPEDVEQRVREALHVIWQDKAEAIEQEACQNLRVISLRDYFRKQSGFFADHLNRYSISRRKAPIYWPLSTPSCCYTLWLYYHRISDQTLFTCVNDFLDPKLKQVSEEVSSLRQKKDRSAVDEKELERLTDFESELKDFRAELLRVAAFWKPNLNDGVQITAAPLWQLFHHKPWQKKLKATWEKLEAGEYDWAHLAYSIWPERVREKCKTDKSFAIAHDLEHLHKEQKIPLKKKRG